MSSKKNISSSPKLFGTVERSSRGDSHGAFRLVLRHEALPTEEIGFSRRTYGDRFPQWRPQVGEDVEFELREGYNTYYAASVTPLLASQMIGKISFWNQRSGLLKTTTDEEELEVFVHQNDFWTSNRNRPAILKGDNVAFTLVHRDHGRPRARNVTFFRQTESSENDEFSGSEFSEKFSEPSRSVKSSRSNSIVSTTVSVTISEMSKMSISDSASAVSVQEKEFDEKPLPANHLTRNFHEEADGVHKQIAACNQEIKNLEYQIQNARSYKSKTQFERELQGTFTRKFNLQRFLRDFHDDLTYLGCI